MIRSLNSIAAEIESDWVKVSFHARPYLEAMKSLDSIDDPYGLDSAESVVLYFLSNASHWQGATARRIKAELRRMTK
jgi:hypothetical protein